MNNPLFTLALATLQNVARGNPEIADATCECAAHMVRIVDAYRRWRLEEGTMQQVEIEMIEATIVREKLEKLMSGSSLQQTSESKP